MDDKLVSFENSYVQTDNFTDDEGDIFASVTIDGFPEDEDKEGQVVAVVLCSLHGDIMTDWHHNGYRMNKTILKLIQESKEMLRDMYHKASTTVD